MTESKPLPSTESSAGCPRVVLVGRPNVGKSTLFNRLIGKRKALVHDAPGLTRDVIEGELEWAGRRLLLTDLAGLDTWVGDEATPEQHLHEEVLDRVRREVQRADLVLFIVDARAGLTLPDEALASELRKRAAGPIFLVINKAEGSLFHSAIGEFAGLGMQPSLCVSAEHGDGTVELLDEVVAQLAGHAPLATGVDLDEGVVELGIVGRPNVGKSLLFNQLVGESRAVVSSVAGTTRDPVDVVVVREGIRLRVVDTAGLRRRGRVSEAPEALSTALTRKRIDLAHIVVVVLDATQPVAHQDAAIAGLAKEAGKAVLLALNKWDLVEDPQRRRREIEDELDRHMRFLSWAPRVTVSALTGSGLPGLLKAVARLDRAHAARVPTAALNRLMTRELADIPLRGAKGQAVRVLYATQVAVRPPNFAIYLNRTCEVHFSTRRFVENRLRRALDLEGTPVRLSFRVG